MLLLAIFGEGWLREAWHRSTVSPQSLTELERQFHGADARCGPRRDLHRAGRDDRGPRSDRYDISSVEKVGNDLWRFNANGMLRLCQRKPSPSFVPLRWYGDTPMIMMTNTSLQGWARSPCACSSTAIGMRVPGKHGAVVVTCRDRSRGRLVRTPSRALSVCPALLMIVVPLYAGSSTRSPDFADSSRDVFSSPAWSALHLARAGVTLGII